MKLTFIGADHEVTGSCTLLQIGSAAVFIDCGMEQGSDVFENIPSPVPPEQIDYVFLTHAHIDHSGNLPLLYKKGFRGKIFATPETCHLCDIMLRDSAHIQMSEAEYHSRKAERGGREKVDPIYDMDDAIGAVSLMEGCDYGEILTVNENIRIRFTDIGHLLGSACIEIWLTENGVEKKIVFSGDVGNTDQPIINDPKTVDEADYLVIESTYGDRLHEARRDNTAALAAYIQKTLDRGGNVVIPSFAVGRTQEMLYFIRDIKERGLIKGHDGFPVYVDSPLANEATEVFLHCHRECLDPDTQAVMAAGVNPITFEGLKSAVTLEESKFLNFDPTPKVIISASGMCDAGRIRHHLKYNLWRPECLILFVGYQAEGTLGRTLYEGATSVKLFGDEIAVRAEIGTLQGMSGHADKNGLLNWIGSFQKKPSQVFVNHGEKDVCESFAECLSKEHGFKAYAPYSGTVYDLAEGRFLEMPAGVPVAKKKLALERKNKYFAGLVEAAERLLEFAKSCEGRANRDLSDFTAQINALIEKWR